MRASRILLVLIIVASLAALANQASHDQDGQAVLAVINGTKLMLADLEQKQAATLLAARYQYYHAEREALDQMIDDSLLERQAQHEHLTVQQLLDREVNSKVKDPTEDQLQVYYEGLQTDSPYAEVRGKILDTIHQIRTTKARTEYLKSLRNQMSVQVLLAPPSAEVALNDAPTRGPQNAAVMIIEFADYECPYCQKIDPALKRLQEEFAGKAAFAFKDFPLPMHQHAEKAAEAARCARRQGKYWEFHDLLFENANKLAVGQLKEDARTLKLDTASFDKCLDSGEEAAGIKKDSEQGQRLGLSGTPSFLINGHFISGAASYATLREVVEQQLSLTELTRQEAARK